MLYELRSILGSRSDASARTFRFVCVISYPPLPPRPEKSILANGSEISRERRAPIINSAEESAADIIDGKQ